MADYTFDAKEVLDLEAGLGRVRGKKSLFKRMLGLFEASEEFAGFDAAMDAGDYQKASEHAHAIKGMTANLGMDALAKYSEELMVQLRDGSYQPETLEQYRAALAATKDAVAQVKPTLDE